MDPTIFAKDEYIETQDLRLQIKKEEHFDMKQEEMDTHAFKSFQNKIEVSSESINRNYIETKVEDGYQQQSSNTPGRYLQENARRLSRKKPFKIVRDLPNLNKGKKNVVEQHKGMLVKNELEEENEDHEMEKKIVRVSACKNYIGLLCAGFSRTILNAEETSPVIETLTQIIEQKKTKFDTCRILQTDKIIQSFKTYIYKSVCGKRVKKCNQERDFKIRNSHELDNILMIKQRDSEQTCLRKEVLKEMIMYFFDSDYYYEWLTKGMISEGNRIFFIKNKKEIQKKFLNPAFYKPKFNHNQEEEKLLSE